MSSNPDIPPFIGYVETTVNALRVIYAARQGVIPRITRRLNDSERRSMIKSGSVFVFSVEESGIKRWTDGLLWSPSRIVGNFLVYREINERTSSRATHKKPYPGDDSPTRMLARKSSPDQTSLGFKHGGTEQGTFKVGGLIKKTITVTIEGSDLHLISYYTSEDIRSGKLKRPSSRPDIMSLYLPPHIFRLTNFRVPPKQETGPDGKPRLVENEEVENVDCKVEDHNYSLSGSPTWSGQSSPASTGDNPFNGDSVYHSLGGMVQGANGNAAVYNARHAIDRWNAQNDPIPTSLRHDVNWSQSTGTGISVSHGIPRRRDSSVHADAWPSFHSQSGRWQGQDTQSNTVNGYHQHHSHHDRNGRSHGVRSTSHLYDDVSIMQHQQRREHENIQPSMPLRYTSHHPTSSRESALQRLHWQSRDIPDPSRELRRVTATSTATATGQQPSTHSYSSSPPAMTFGTQGYTSSQTQTYAPSSWTSPDQGNIGVSTPSLHPISPPTGYSYDGTYSSSTPSLPSSEDFATVDSFRDS